MKTHVRTLWGSSSRRAWWSNDRQRESLRGYLNEIGFYVLNGPGDSLDVYAIENDEPVDVKYLKKILEIARKSWHTMKGGE